MFSRFCSVWVVLQRQKRPKKEGKVTNVSHAGESIWHCSNSPMVRSPKTQWRVGKRGQTQTFSLLRQKDHSKVGGGKEGEDEEAVRGGCRLTLLPLRRGGLVRTSEQKTINSRIAFQITRHLGLRGDSSSMKSKKCRLFFFVLRPNVC